jgi:site-specific recombinase XerD
MSIQPSSRNRATPLAAASKMLRFHDLRHGSASLLIASGVELVEVSQLLGHADIRVTAADLYAHLQKQTAAKAATIMGGVLGHCSHPRGVS